jgi:hypothetical protein
MDDQSLILFQGINIEVPHVGTWQVDEFCTYHDQKGA